jgi:hypothetical protein
MTSEKISDPTNIRENVTVKFRAAVFDDFNPQVYRSSLAQIVRRQPPGRRHNLGLKF